MMDNLGFNRASLQAFLIIGQTLIIKRIINHYDINLFKKLFLISEIKIFSKLFVLKLLTGRPRLLASGISIEEKGFSRD